jgi:hypothetical protein
MRKDAIAVAGEASIPGAPSTWTPWLGDGFLSAALGGYFYWFIHKHVSEAKHMEEMLKELEATRAGRDAAVGATEQAFKLVENLIAVEKLLRGKLKVAEDALKKEREDGMEKFHKDFEARQNLEKANEHWKSKHGELESKCAQLEAKCARLEATVQQHRSGAKNVIDGWWAPPKAGKHTLKGVLVDFIDKDSSDALQFNALVFRLVEPCDGCRDGAEGDDELHKALAGSLIGVPEWKQLVGLWPEKAGHRVHITRGETRDIGMGRRMYSVEAQVSKKPVNKPKKRRRN